ncbi:MAG: polyprenyl synthetase family protein [Kiritimatiellae bacterium]|nr:polyprenyl synthetase family protein [Kiritimatiellia bacterium]
MFDLDEFIADKLRLINRELRSTLPRGNILPRRLHQIMRYAVFPGGKRIRPVLCLTAAEAVGAPARVALPAAVALELVHSYSLVHDDLPCMDNDLVRRGKPTVHARFGEASALLAGDALLTLAFEVLASSPASSRHPTSRLVAELARTAGSRGLVAGQYLDITALHASPGPGLVRRIHRLKTAELFRCAMRLGAMSGNATDSAIHTLDRYGLYFGLAFQITDDILDARQTRKGKKRELTCLRVLSLHTALARAYRYGNRAVAIARGFQNDAGKALAALAARVVERTS